MYLTTLSYNSLSSISFFAAASPLEGFAGDAEDDAIFMVDDVFEDEEDEDGES